jgi:RNA polymerase sigma-70 factor (ECF subfamily)
VSATKHAPEFTSCLRTFEVELDYVLRALRRHGVTERDAEDLAQDVFLVMWRRWSDFDPGRPLRPWLAGIAFKVAHEHHRRSQRMVPRAVIEPVDEGPPPDDQIATARARALVISALGRLPERQRALLVMHDVDGVPMQEIARLMAVPIFTGYSRLRLARKAFAKMVARTETPALTPASLLELERNPAPAPVPVRERALSRARALLLLPERQWPAPPASAPAPLWPVAIGAALGLAVVMVWLAATPSSAARASAAPSLGATLGRGIIGYWRFDESSGSTVRDLSGNGNDCTLRPAGRAQSWTAGVLGGAIALDGKGWLECARREPVAQLGRELTISVWVRPSRVVAGRQVFVGRQLGEGREDYFSLSQWNASLEVRGHLWQSLTRRYLPPLDGRWLHAAAVQRADGRRLLYLDGVEVGSSNRSKPVSLGGGTTPLTIGGAINGTDPTLAEELFQGALDELLLYDRALTPAEINALAARTQPAPASRLVALP